MPGWTRQTESDHDAMNRISKACGNGSEVRHNWTDEGSRRTRPPKSDKREFVSGGFGPGQDRYDREFDPDGRDKGHKSKRHKRKSQR